MESITIEDDLAFKARKSYKLPKQTKDDLSFLEVHIAPWDSKDGRRSYSVIGLTKEGRVYRYDAACDGWVPWSMRLAPCDRHKR